MHMEICRRSTKENGKITDAQNKANQHTLFWNASVLELVELVLRPQKGGPPSLPEQGDAVFPNPLCQLIEFSLACLNFMRFLLCH